MNIEYRGDVGLIGLQLGNLARDLDRLCDRPHLQLGIDTHNSIHVDASACYVIALEPGRFDMNLIVVRNQVRNREVPAFVGSGFLRRPF